jgi:RIO kinase 1
MRRVSRDDAIFREIDRKEGTIPGRRGKDLKTWGGVFDQPTVMTLHRLLANGVLGSIDFPVSTGKEADVFKATDGDGIDVVIKVYRYSTPTFQKVLQYIEGDQRFHNVPRDKRSLVQAWTKKEYRNLERFREAGLDVPVPYKWTDNVLVMEYIQGENGPARTMKEQPPEDPKAAFDKLWGDYRRLLRNAKSVHADFSEYNCLMDDGVARIIDCGQAVLTTHPMADEFMERDVRNLARYFTRARVGLDVEAMVAEARRLLEQTEPEEEDLEEGF